MGWDAFALEHLVCLRRYAEAFVEASREDDNGGAVLQQQLHVGRLYAGVVAGAGLVPVPLLGASREEPGVLEGAGFRLQAAP